jgi:hypothetical protein
MKTQAKYITLYSNLMATTYKHENTSYIHKSVH